MNVSEDQKGYLVGSLFLGNGRSLDAVVEYTRNRKCKTANQITV